MSNAGSFYYDKCISKGVHFNVVKYDIQPVGFIEIDGFAKFADFFFDGLISDWVVQSRINDSLESVGKVKDEVNSVLRKLQQMKTVDKENLVKSENELSSLIENA